MTNYEKLLLEDFAHRDSYGKPLIGWNSTGCFFKDSSAAIPPALAGPLKRDLAAAFVEQVYFLLLISRFVTVYRGFEAPGLKAPYGKDHPSVWFGLVQQRTPGTRDGYWWSPRRPSIEIDGLQLPHLHRGEDRNSLAVKREWNRMDYFAKGELPPGSLVYAGRAAPQRESELYGGRSYAGGGMQFLLTKSPDLALTNLRIYEIK